MVKNLINSKIKDSTKQISKYANPTYITKYNNIMGGTGFSREAFYDSTSTIPNFYTPELTPDTWLLPRSRAEILRWCRLFFNLDPYINSILTMHAQYPICNFRLKYKDKETEAFFNRKLFDNKEFSWVDFLEQIMLSYWKLGEACLTGDTKIKLLDGTTKTIKELYDSNEKGFWVYSIDSEGNIVPGKADEVVLTRKSAEVVKITFDNGESLRCTPDHKIMLRDGSYKEAKDLVAGDALMPLYYKDSYTYYNKNHSKHKYELIYNPGIAKFDKSCGHWKFTHRLVSKYINGDSKGKIIHHSNFNNKDNTPENLVVLTPSEHRNIHAKNYSEEEINNFRQKTKENYEKPGYREKMSVAISKGMTPRVRKILSEKSKAYWSQEEHKEEARKRGLGRKHTPETIEKLKAMAKERYQKNPDEVMKRLQKATESAVKANTGKKHTEEYKQHMSNLMKDKWKKGIYKNHKVAKVEFCGFEDVYDIHSSGEYHNFAIETGDGSGIFVHNCVWGDWNEAKGTWNNFSLIDPSLIEYKEDPVSGEVEMSIIPTRELKQMLAEGLKQGRSDIPVEYIKCVQENQKIPLDATGTEPNYLTGRKYSPAKVFMLARKTDPGATRGTPIIQSLFKTLIYSDKIRLAQIAIADRLHLPMEIWTIGEYTGDPNTSIIPDDGMITNVREAIREATMQPPFSIFVPPYIKYEAVGVNGKLLSVYEDLGYVENCIFVALGVNKNLILGQGPSFSSSKQTSLFKLIKTYKMMRLKLEAFIKRYIILPIAKANDVKDEYGDYVVPDIEWEESLNPEQDVEKFNNVLKLWDKGLVSTTTLYEYFPGKLDINLEKQRMEEEKLTIFDKGTDRLGSKAQRSDLKNTDNGGKNPKPSDGSKPATNLPPPMEGDVKEETEEPTNSDNMEEGSEPEEQQGE